MAFEAICLEEGQDFLLEEGNLSRREGGLFFAFRSSLRVYHSIAERAKHGPCNNEPLGSASQHSCYSRSRRGRNRAPSGPPGRRERRGSRVGFTRDQCTRKPVEMKEGWA